MTTLSASLQPSDFWCRDSKGVRYSFAQFLERITVFHGYPSPGLVIGGKMVDLALAEMPAGCIFDAISETSNCLPDAVQILTPCTIGNGWLKLLDFGRFALSLYDKESGKGVRVALHPKKVAAWDRIDGWFFKRQPKAEQDTPALLAQIQTAADNILTAQPILVHSRFMAPNAVGVRALCRGCGESYPLKHGLRCRACQNESPYVIALQR